MSTQIQIRRDTTANWESVNPTMADGEVGYDTTENKFKVGNGLDDWNSLSYTEYDGDLDDAPNDGKLYGRQSEGWEEVPEIDWANNDENSNTISLGWANRPQGSDQIVIGKDSASKSESIAIGKGARAESEAVVVGGSDGSAEYGGTAIGYNANAGESSIALGSYVIARDFEFAIGGEIKTVNFSRATVQAADYLDADGNSIIGSGEDSRITNQQITNWDVSFGWGDHSGLYLETETDPTVPQYVKAISQADIDKWNNPPSGGGAVDSVNGKTGAVTLTHVDVGAERAFTKNNAFNKNFGTSGSTVAYGNHNHSGVYQPAGSYATSGHNHSGVYQPVGNYATTSYSYSKNESDGKYALKGSGGSDPNAVKLTGNQTISGVKTFSDVLYFSNMFVSGVPAAGVGIAGKARIEFSPGATTIYSGTNTLQVNDSSGTSVTSDLICNDGRVIGPSFYTSLINQPNVTVMNWFGRAIHSQGSGGVGFYFSNTNTITPTGPSDINVDDTISLGNPNYKWFRVWSGNTYSSRRAMQNDNEAVLSVTDLIDVMQDLRTATKDEKTVDGLRDSIGNCIGGVIEKLEAIQFAAEEERQKAIEESKQDQAEEDLRRLQESKLRTELPQEQ